MRSIIGGLRRALGSAPAQTSSGNRKRSKRTNFEPLEKRCLLAGDVLASIAGTVYDDQTGNGFTPDDVGIPGVVVDLYRDGGDGAFGGVVPGSDDAHVGVATTAANGSYGFTGLDAGRYFVQQQPAAGYLNAGPSSVRTIVITPTDLMGVSFTPIDTFVTKQHVTASSLGARSGEDATIAPDALGGERDLYVELTSAYGELQLSVNSFGAPMFQYDSSAATTGRRVVTWDGVDGDGVVLNPTGIRDASGVRGVDLTENGAVEGIRFLSGADHDGGNLTLRLYTDSNHWSYANIAVPNTGSTGTAPFVLRFSNLVDGGAGGVDLTNVGAIQMEIDGAIAVDGQITRIDTFGPKVIDADFLNIQPTDLVINKADNPDPVIAGQQLTYTLTVTNNSLLTATGVVVTDQLPDDVTYVSSTSTQGGTSHAAGTVSANLGTMAPGANATVTILVDVHADAAATLFNTATVSGNEVEVTLTNNRDDEPTAVVRVWDLEIDKADDPDTVVAGEQLTYTLAIRNNSLHTATGVVVTDQLPSDVTYLSSTTTQGGTSHAGGIVTANLGTMAPGEVETVTILVDVNSDAAATLYNTATVAGNEVEVTLANNMDDEETQVVRVWDLEIDKTDNPDPVVAGGDLTYTLLVTNNGPSDAADVEVVDALPPEVSYVSSTTTQGTVSHAGGTVTADLGDLPAGDSATITILTKVSGSASGQIDNSSIVGGRPVQPGQAPTETRTDNNRADEPTLIVAPDSSISGYVYVDIDDDGVFDPTEQPLSNVLILLSGFDFLGNPVTRQAYTGLDGGYSFRGLLPGSYTVDEVQPPAPFRDGKDTPGTTLGGAALLTFGVADDVFSNIGLAGNVDVIDFNFGELMFMRSKRDFIN